jgi:hypothetical protein
MIDGYTHRFCDFLKGSAGCHPKLLTFSKHFDYPSRLSPSQVLKITLQAEGPVSVKEVFLEVHSVIPTESLLES